MLLIGTTLVIYTQKGYIQGNQIYVNYSRNNRESIYMDIMCMLKLIIFAVSFILKSDHSRAKWPFSFKI